MTAVTPAAARHIGWIRPAAGLGLSGVFLYLTLRGVDGAGLLEVLRHVSPLLPVLALVVVLVELGIRAWRWRTLLAPLGDVPLTRAYEYLAIGHFANTLLPARLGDAARAYLAGGAFGVSRLEILGTIVVERLSDGLFILSVVVIAVLFGSPDIAPLAAGAAAAALLGGLLVVAAVIVVTRGRVARTNAAGWMRRTGGRILVGARAVGTRRGALTVLAATAASFLAAVLVFDLTTHAIGVSLAPWQSAIVIGAASLSTAIPAGPGSLGTYEFVGVTVMSSMGIGSEQAFVAVAMCHVLITLPPALIGLVGTWRRHLAIPRVADLDAEAA